MKKLVLLPLLFLATQLMAQDGCSRFYPTEKGTSFEVTHYDKKNKVNAITAYTVGDATSDGVTYNTVVQNDKKEEIAKGSFGILCEDGGISIDFKSLFSAQMQEQYANMETSFSGTNIDLPNDLSVGQTLPDANMTMKVNMGGIGMNMTVNILNRKVEKREEITTPAGTFDCYVITYTNQFKMGMTKKFDGKQWIADGVGLVKHEDYNKKGKVLNSSMLTAFQK
ncbi:TapB family protein [Sediminicola luteus]|uniref:DUF3108 domain-containing protein n=1 Tax=Sediminicola luteus TaxID=319238 RepID=A0A2A4G9V1_9FLAO|nr:hypothetical protein [Sediminicola luteus]PCE65729.1 hypothetical protein B7P33_00025 [Sediminicola luteus]